MAWNPLKKFFLDDDDDELPTTDSLLSKKIKLITVGDEGVGKRRLCRTFARSRNSTWDNFADNVKVEGSCHDVMFINTTTVQEAFQQVQPIYTPKTQCIMLCFSVVDRISFENITKKWIPQVKHHCPQIPSILIGTKTDLRQEGNKDHVTTKEGSHLSKRIDAKFYVESSVETRNFDDAIERAISVAINDSDNCVIM